MPKPKPTEKMIRVNFTLPESLKEEWEKFSKDRHISMSQLVRNAVYDYQMKYKQLEQPQLNPELQLLEMRYEKMINEKMAQIVQELKPIKSENVENLEELKGRILRFIEKYGPQKSVDLSDVLGISRDIIIKITKEMFENKILTVEKGFWRIL